MEFRKCNSDIRAGVDRNENTVMLRVLKVPQLTHSTSRDVNVSGLLQMQVRKKGKGLCLFCECKLQIANKMYCTVRLH